MKTYGLIGYPLSHSFSPGYFFEKFQRESIRDAHYSLFPLSEISEFPNLIKEKKPAGLNVTIPYKEAVLQYADGKSQETEAIGACNVLSFDYNHGNQKIMAHNTDWIGFERSLPLNFISEKALIIGNGGSSGAVAFALKKLKIDFVIAARNPKSKSEMKILDIDSGIIRERKLIINCTPLGMLPHTEDCPDIPYGDLGPSHFLYDLIYNPAKTKFLMAGEKAGSGTKNGMEMLQIQAEESWKIWNAPATV